MDCRRKCHVSKADGMAPCSHSSPLRGAGGTAIPETRGSSAPKAFACIVCLFFGSKGAENLGGRDTWIDGGCWSEALEDDLVCFLLDLGAYEPMQCYQTGIELMHRHLLFSASFCYENRSQTLVLGQDSVLAAHTPKSPASKASMSWFVVSQAMCVWHSLNFTPRANNFQMELQVLMSSGICMWHLS